ncbi:NF-kappa-B inhibitor zeta-like [Seriola lalandi dorsalis]|uniref:NF-kappa-B inhibitor zeta-like n=1 Tax=Seriola lalandi dorsalis TaxID=1841481 RepID=A0A3B4XMH0_SERLL|nr:NF-kappa-B inhibitor zeta-like [Seriola lalandi dorsalis]
MHNSFNMLDPRVSENRGNQILSTATDFSQDYKGFLITDPRPPGYIQAMQKKNTVKELLKMKRQVNEQEWNFSQEGTNTEHEFKCAKLEPFDSDASPHILSPRAPASPKFTPNFHPASSQNGHITPQQMQHPAPQGQAAPTTEVKMSLFHWQIQQEAKRVGGVSPELLNKQDADGDTFLHIAVAQGRRALAYVLAAKMASSGSLDTKEHNGQTALHIAATTNQHLIAHDLLANGAQVNTRDFWGRSPLHVCVEKGHFLSLQSIWRTLTASGRPIDIDVFNYDGLTPLHVAVLSHNAVVKEQRCLENPCTYMAAELVRRRQTLVECVKTVLLMGASHGTKDLKSGRTCLHMASEEANVELLQLFLDRPSAMTIVNVKTFSGNTALHIVSCLQNRQTQVEAVKLLMRKGADPGSKNFENELPSQLVPEGPIGEKGMTPTTASRLIDKGLHRGRLANFWICSLCVVTIKEMTG